MISMVKLVCFVGKELNMANVYWYLNRQSILSCRGAIQGLHCILTWNSVCMSPNTSDQNVVMNRHVH